jgi:alpha-1,2-mannosyltransferase
MTEALLMLENLRNGAWLTGERLRVYPVILLAIASAAALAVWATSHAGFDAFGRPLGTDFSAIWTAGRESDHCHPALPYDVAAFRDAQEQFFGVSKEFYTWAYPPYFLALAAILAPLLFRGLAALANDDAAALSRRGV